MKTGAALLVALVVLGSGTFLAPRLVGASTTAGAVYAWIDNDAGQFCNGTVTVTGSNHDSKTPVPTRLAPALAVAAGQSHTLAVGTNGAAYGCGLNGSGQLGNASIKNSPTPVRAALPTGVVVTAVAAGWKTSLALTSTGAVYAWGLNTFGQIGDGSTSNRNTPVLVHLPTGVVVTAIAAGQYHCLAVTSTGAVYAWGYNGFGQLGNGGTTRSTVPVPVSLPAGVVAASIGAGDNHSLVVSSVGSIYAFGKNSFGQLGNGTTIQSNVPVVVSLPTGVVATQVAAGGISPTAQVPEGDYTLAVTTAGTVYAWGADAQGQLGNNGTTNSSIPVVTQLPSGAIATAVGAGPNFGHALTTDGNIYYWGTEGNGTFRHLMPTATPLPNGLHGAVVSAGPDGEQIAAVMVSSSRSVASLTVTPNASTIAAGGTQTYTVTGKDGFGNSLGDVTSSTGFVVTNGSCTANVCGSSTAGTQTVTATDGVAQTTAALTVSSGSLTSLAISPTISTIAPGATQAYTVTGYDGFGNSLGDVTGSTGFVVTNGTCTANVCRSSTTGTQTVTATDGSATITAALTVSTGATPTPITHVVIFYDENHSFDNILGAFCNSTTPARCDGGTTGQLATGQTIPLAPGPDIVPVVSHASAGQVKAINGGKMNGFSMVKGCAAPTYSCYQTYQQAVEPNVWALGSKFAVSDRTFEINPVPTWGAHVELVTSLLDGFLGDNPTATTGPGWGCDSGGVVNWSATGLPPFQVVPSCIPKADGTGAFQATPVKWVPTIMDALTTAGKTWKFYAAAKTDSEYERSICPSFADCLDTPQVNNVVPSSQIVTDAQAGTLPNFSILLPSSGPTGSTSEHNGQSMAVGDNWIGQAISAIESGPNWGSTAIFLTWDDCGCFYDHVPPPTGTNLGIRVPMIMISPYAKAGYTDHTVASFASLLSFSEYTLGVAPLSSVDATAYNYLGAFDFAQTPLTGAAVVRTVEPAASKLQIKLHPPDPNDPT